MKNINTIQDAIKYIINARDSKLLQIKEYKNGAFQILFECKQYFFIPFTSFVHCYPISEKLLHCEIELSTNDFNDFIGYSKLVQKRKEKKD